MEHETAVEAEADFKRAKEVFDEGNIVAALALFEKALQQKDDVRWYSFLGYCVARERGQFKRGLELCRLSLQEEPENPVHYLNLGLTSLVSGDKEEAIRIFREGMGKGGSEEILEKLAMLGMRKSPIFRSLERSHPLNKYLGLFLSRLGLR